MRVNRTILSETEDRLSTDKKNLGVEKFVAWGLFN